VSNVLKTSPAVESFNCCWRDGQGSQWATLSGELDATTAPELEYAFREADLGADLIVVDMRDLALMDGAGADVIASAAEALAKAGRRLVVVRGPEAVDAVFTLALGARSMKIVDLPLEPAHVLGHR
jgi:anti-anti-sigma factor